MSSLLPRQIVTASALGAIVFASACASRAADPGSPFSSELAERGEIRIVVTNLNFSDATVWALIRDVERQRLGRVIGKRNAEFTIPWEFSTPLRIEFDLLAGPRCLTEDIMVDPGDILDLQIESNAENAPECR